MMTSSEIRQKFLDFFASKGHVIVPSAPIVMKNDPTLMFTNAGMNQFKDYFLGNKPAPHKKVVDTQKCLRVSGKHNDLEEVGVDTYHHTMFEMLGNWSFGDYFKKEAIAWSWELLTKVYGLDKSRLYVTIFEGDEREGLPKDEEAYNEWKKWIAEDRIIMGNKKDNFWEMGDTGPCGPCTEIHVDTRPEANNDGHSLVNNDDTGMVMEIWNNVFIQFNRSKDGSLEPLPAKHVDTGMGLERLTRVLQGKISNYDTDVFTGTIAETGKKVNKVYKGGDDKESIAFRVIADHIRAIAFTIADGQLPSNTGAGYVIRRILRRAVRYYYSYLDYKQPLLFQLIPVLAKQFENVFPELYKQGDFVSKVVREEEDAFLRTLDKGLKRVDDLIAQGNISPRESFELYDTYGFPFDLTQLIATENNLKVDEAGFKAEMEQQKNRSRAATAVDTEDWIVLDDYARNEFIGYDSLESETKVVKYRKVKAKGKEGYQIVLEVTPFYGESGGQVGDKGELIINGEKLIVTDTKKDNDLIIHVTDSIPADLSGEVIAKVDPIIRKNTELHHSATHLVHSALRKVLGTHVAQKGSLVNDEHLRFDFSHFAKVSDEEIAKIDALVNKKIRENIPVVIKEMSKDEAMKMGAMALFGEKYGDVVRVVIIDPRYSVELCGGTHVGSTGELGLFKITHETAVAAGVRRIEAVCGEACEEYINKELEIFRTVKNKLKINKDIIQSVDKFIEEKNEIEKRLENIEVSKSKEIYEHILKEKIIKMKDISIVSAVFDSYSSAIFNSVFNNILTKTKDSIIILGATIQDQETFRFFVNTKIPNYVMNINAELFFNTYLQNQLIGIAKGGQTILNASGKFKDGIEKVVENARIVTINTIKGLESFNEFLNSKE